jgi:hypothetical protein
MAALYGDLNGHFQLAKNPRFSLQPCSNLPQCSRKRSRILKLPKRVIFDKLLQKTYKDLQEKGK